MTQDQGLLFILATYYHVEIYLIPRRKMQSMKEWKENAGLGTRWRWDTIYGTTWLPMGQICYTLTSLALITLENYNWTYRQRFQNILTCPLRTLAIIRNIIIKSVSLTHITTALYIKLYSNHHRPCQVNSAFWSCTLGLYLLNCYI